MKICLLSTAFLATLAAQNPPSPVKPDTVVARVGDKEVTAGEIEKLLAGNSSGSRSVFPAGPGFGSHRGGSHARYVAAEADKMKLGEQSPWREQMEIARENILVTAMTRYVADHYEVTAEMADAYYKQHAGSYQQMKIKAIKINFKPAATASSNDLAAAARGAFETAHAATERSEADAKKIADEVSKQARAGTDFAQLVDKYAEGESKDFAGDFPTVKQTSNFPADFKKAVFAMKTGEVSDPIRQSNCFYVIRVTEVSAQPLNEVREDIVHTIRTQHVSEYVDGLRAQFKAVILKPEYFVQMSSPRGN